MSARLENIRTRLEQLLQIFGGETWDGDLISKKETAELESCGLVQRNIHGKWIVTAKGIEVVSLLGLDVDIR